MTSWTTSHISYLGKDISKQMTYNEEMRCTDVKFLFGAVWQVWGGQHVGDEADEAGDDDSGET